MSSRQDSALAVICDFSSPFELSMETRTSNVVTLSFSTAHRGNLGYFAGECAVFVRLHFDTSSLARYRPCRYRIHPLFL